MTGPLYACPNGHAATLAGQRFCETCGAPVGQVAPAAQPAPPPAAPGWGQPAAQPAPPPAAQPAPPPAAPGWGQPAAQPAPPPAAPGWGQAPPPAASATGQPGAPAWGAAPGGVPSGAPGSSRGRGPIVAIGVVLAAVALFAVVLVVVRPFGGAAGGSPSPIAVATTAPTAAPAGTIVPSATDAIVPTLEPSAAIVTFPPLVPGSTPDATTVPVQTGAPAGSTCRSETVGITVAYPAGWYTVEDDPTFACLLFDPDPIVILPETELPPVAVLVYEDARPFSEVASDFGSTSVYTVLDTQSGTLGDREATVWELENTGEGFYEKGVRQVVVAIDRGERGTLVLETVGVPGDEYDRNIESLGQIVESIQID